MSGLITASTTLVRAGDPITAAVGDDLVMMDVDKGKYFGLNDVAAFIWKRLETPVVVADLCAELQTGFDVSPEQCEPDVLAFLRSLHAEGLLCIVE